MFLDYYQMHTEPFGVTPDHRFLYLGNSHREALASLFYGVESDRAFMVLIAPPGSGKTTLIHQLIERLEPGARTVFLFQTQCNAREMMQYLLHDLGVDVTGMETVAMHHKLHQILTQESLAGRRFVLIVDEAHNLDPAVLETIRLLSNFETPRAKLLQILLVGQPQLARKLAAPDLEQLQQRISMFAKLDAFNADETSHYIAHRLKVAGYTGSELFTSGAMEMITQRSKGVPRNINRLCFSALSLACAMGRKRIDAEMMREVVGDLDLAPLERGLAAEPPAGPVPARLREVLTARLQSIPYQKILHSPLLTSRMGVVGVAALAALLLMVPAVLSYSRVNHHENVPASNEALIQTPTQASTPAVSKALPTVGPAPAQPSQALNSVPESVPPPAAKPVTFKVRVRRGETLRQVARRALGQNNSKLLKQIQELNPRITDPDHIEAHQQIRLPQISKATDPIVTAGTNDLSRKN